MQALLRLSCLLGLTFSLPALGQDETEASCTIEMAKGVWEQTLEELVGSDYEASAFTWQGGHLRGWVEFDDRSERIEIDTRSDPSVVGFRTSYVRNGRAAMARELDEHVHGVITVLRKHSTTDEKLDDCVFCYSIQVGPEKSGRVSYSRSWRGKLKNRAGMVAIFPSRPGFAPHSPHLTIGGKYSPQGEFTGQYVDLMVVPAHLLPSGHEPSDDIWKLVEQLLTQADPAIRARAAVLLGELGSAGKAAVPALIGALQDVLEVRSRSQDALGKIGPEAVPALAASLKNQGTRRGAAAALGQIGPAARSAVSELVEALNVDNLAVLQVSDALMKIDPQAARAAIPTLKKHLKDENPRAREGALAALAGIDGRAAIPDLVIALKNDPHVWVRRAAAAALFRVGSEAKSAVPVLVEALTDNNVSVRWSAAAALRNIDPPTVVSFYLKALQGREHSRRSSAAFALADMGALAEGAIPKLIEALNDEDRNTRWRAALVLGAIGPRASAAVQTLTRWLNAKDRDMRWVAADALKNINATAHSDTAWAATRDRPTQSNDQGDQITLLGFDPPLPAKLKTGQQLTLRFSYALTSTERCFFNVEAYTEGRVTPGASSYALGARKGDGIGERSVLLRSAGRIDELRIRMTSELSSVEALVELSLEAAARWQ